jgi:predicted negative regulator of RcsB-dependent stress response
MAENNQQTLEQTLERTDLGHVINENKKLILILAAVVVVLIIVFSFWRYQSNKTLENNLAEVYAFQKDVVDKFVGGDLKEEDFISKTKNLASHLKGQPSLLPSLFKAIDKLTGLGKTTEAVAILEGWTEQFSKDSFNFFFVAMKLVPLYENIQETDKAIVLTQKLIASSIDVARADNYLTLGRLQMKKGDSKSARDSLEFLLKNHESSEASKMAKLYLQQLK